MLGKSSSGVLASELAAALFGEVRVLARRGGLVRKKVFLCILHGSSESSHTSTAVMAAGVKIRFSAAC